MVKERRTEARDFLSLRYIQLGSEIISKRGGFPPSCWPHGTFFFLTCGTFPPTHPVYFQPFVSSFRFDFLFLPARQPSVANLPHPTFPSNPQQVFLNQSNLNVNIFCLALGKTQPDILTNRQRSKCK